MSRTPTRFKQHPVTTTRPMNCYAKFSPRLGRSRHRFFFSPVETWTAVRDQESVSASRKDDGTIIVFFSSRRGQSSMTASARNEGLHRNVGASRFNGPDGRQGCVLARTVESNQGCRFDGNESAADSFRSGAVNFENAMHAIIGAFSSYVCQKTSCLESELLPGVTPVHSFPLRSDTKSF
ncbi:hypothetical protein TNCV_2085701 [Trichonephila clavipes]|nr:hypothetical protein TNCV_2085701 [Trichonephila clavipes]